MHGTRPRMPKLLASSSQPPSPKFVGHLMLQPTRKRWYPLLHPKAPLRKLLLVMVIMTTVKLLTTGGNFFQISDSIDPVSHRGLPRNFFQRLFSLGDSKAPLSGMHTLREDGLMEVNPRGRHPILDLMEAAEKEWNEKVARQSRTLDEAVTEYRRRYRRLPPKGFDIWWKYVEDHNIGLPDEYDRITYDIEPLLGIDPVSLNKLMADEEEYKMTRGSAWIIVKNATHPLGSINKQGEYRLNLEMSVLKMIEDLLPDMRMTLNVNDGPARVMGYDHRTALVEAARNRYYLDGANPRLLTPATRGWVESCPSISALNSNSSHHQPLSPVQISSNSSTTNAPQTPKTFIYDHPKAMNACNHPLHLQQTGIFSSHGPNGGKSQPQYTPVFSVCSTHLHGDILVPPVEMWQADIEGDKEWEDKVDDRLLWRGSPTGTRLSLDNPEWRDSQRIRLVNRTTAKEGWEGVLFPPSGEEEVGEPVLMSAGRLNAKMMDVSFTGSAKQCGYRPGDTTCNDVMREFEFRRFQSAQVAGQYKYVMDIDGNGWSGRFKRLLTSHALVFKATVHPEWFTEKIVPWFHYVPIQMDLSDLYDATVFFHGNLNGESNHDDLARRIAIKGREWSQRYWRMEDMAAYMLRLLLEYARAMSLDRDAMNMDGLV